MLNPNRLLRRLACPLGLLIAVAWSWAGDVDVTVSSPLLTQPEAQRTQEIQARLAATPLSWPGGMMTASEAVALLSASGNPTVLVDSADVARKAQLPPLTGDYWQGVVAVCTAFDLTIEPGEGIEDADDRYGNGDNNGTALALTGGPVLLRGRDPNTQPPLYVPCGAALAQVVAFDLHQRQGAVNNRTANVQISLRVEPRVQSQQIGTTQISWSSIQDAHGRKLNSSEASSGRRAEISTIQLSDVPENFTGCTFTGELMVQILEPVTLSATIRAGEKARVNLLGQEATMQLISEGENAVNGQRGPGFVVSAPTALLGSRPKFTVTLGGQPLKFNNQGSHWSGGRIELFYRGPKLLDGAYVATLSGKAALQQIRVPVRVPISLAGLPKTERPVAAAGGLDLQVPTRVRWEAGECSVSEAVRRLAGANNVLLELGADERRRATLPAFDGHFWDAVLIICRAFDLTILPPSQAVVGQDEDGDNKPTCISGGPLCLGPRHGDRPGVGNFQACGILLMVVDAMTVVTNQGLEGVSRQAEVSYRLRLEPRLDASLIGSATVSWTSLGGIAGDRALVVMEAETEENSNTQTDFSGMRVMRFGRRLVRVAANDAAEEVTATGRVVVSGLPVGQVPLMLTGQVSLHLQRPVRAEVNIDPGARTTTRLGNRVAIVRMFTATNRDQGDSERSGVSVELAGDRIDALAVDVRDAAGVAMTSNGSGNSNAGGRSRMSWYYPMLDKGPYTVVITGRERLGVLRLPFNLSTTTP